MMKKLFVSPRELHELTGLSASTIARGLRNRTIPFTKKNRRVLIPFSYVTQLLDETQINIGASPTTMVRTD